MRGRNGLILLLGVLVCVGCARKKTTDDFIADLKSSKEKERLVAVRMLPQNKKDAAKTVPALIDALKDKDNDVRLSAAIGLGYYGEEAKDAIPALQAAQRDRDARVREAAAVALSRIDPVKFSPPSSKRPAAKK